MFLLHLYLFKVYFNAMTSLHFNEKKASKKLTKEKDIYLNAN